MGAPSIEPEPPDSVDINEKSLHSVAKALCQPGGYLV